MEQVTEQYAETPESRELGFVEHSVPDKFLEALPDDEVAAWEGSG